MGRGAAYIFSSRFILSSAHGIASEFDLVSVVQQSIACGICQSGVSDTGVPIFDRALAGDNNGPRLIAVLDHLQQIAAFPIG